MIRRISRKRHRFIRRQTMGCGSAFGWVLEDEVETYLRELLATGSIASYVRYKHHSVEDCSGRDFTVEKQVKGTLVNVSFGVTISAESCTQSRERHWPVPQFWFPVGTSKKMITATILNLFKPLPV